MQVQQIKEAIFIITDILDLENYPELFNTVMTESNIKPTSKGGRKMCRMTEPGMKYTIGGHPYARKNYTETVKKIRREIETKLRFTPGYFNTCTLNYYANGNSGFRNHSDSMPDLEQPMYVTMLTLGDSNRVMELTNRQTGEVYRLELPHNSMILMGPYMQRTWYHGVPHDKSITKPRLSLSFRRQKVGQMVQAILT